VVQSDSNGETKEAFGKRLAIHGFVNAMLSTGITPQAIDGTLIQDLLSLESRLDTFLNPSAFRQAVQAKAPSVVNPPIADDVQEYADEMEQEINVDDIPFN
jgi:hypothetical protein